jgi:hypothetical protein
MTTTTHIADRIHFTRTFTDAHLAGASDRTSITYPSATSARRLEEMRRQAETGETRQDLSGNAYRISEVYLEPGRA